MSACLCQIVYTWLHLCVCGDVEDGKNAPERVCVRERQSVCVLVHFLPWLKLHNRADSPHQALTLLHHSSLPPLCHPTTRKAFPEHTANKVGQVCGWTLFLSESNFQVVPTSKQGPAALNNGAITRSPSLPPLTSAGLLPYIHVKQEWPNVCIDLFMSWTVLFC